MVKQRHAWNCAWFMERWRTGRLVVFSDFLFILVYLGTLLEETMNLDKIVEEAIKNAQRDGKFNNLPGKGKPIDLTAYFETPEEVRMAQTVLKNSGFSPVEVDLLNEIAALKKSLASISDESKRVEITKTIRDKQLDFNLRMERMRK